ncbi:MAG TPA: PTS sugar transporter subunit IIA [Tissierellaceae bacterium]
MHNVIIIMGHGNYATGLKSSIELITGIVDNVYAIDFVENDSDITLKHKIKEIFDKHPKSSILIVCDIVGGTPFKVAAEFVINSDKDVVLIGGCNLSGILEIILQKDNVSINRLAELAVETTKNTVLHFEKSKVQKSSNERSKTTEGI